MNLHATHFENHKNEGTSALLAQTTNFTAVSHCFNGKGQNKLANQSPCKSTLLL